MYKKIRIKEQNLLDIYNFVNDPIYEKRTEKKNHLFINRASC